MQNQIVISETKKGLLNYATKKELDHAADTGISDLALVLIVLKAENGKLNFNTLVNVPISLNNYKSNSRWFRCW